MWQIMQNDGPVIWPLLDEVLIITENTEWLRIKEKIERRQDTHGSEVQIFAGKSVSYQELFQVLDCVKQAGLAHISLQAEMAEASP